jgi:hypothetical protein
VTAITDSLRNGEDFVFEVQFKRGSSGPRVTTHEITPEGRTKRIVVEAPPYTQYRFVTHDGAAQTYLREIDTANLR